MPIQMSKYWNIQKIITFFFRNFHLSVVDSLKKIILGFLVIGK